MKYEHLDRNVYESPYSVKKEFIQNNPSQMMGSPVKIYFFFNFWNNFRI